MSYYQFTYPVSDAYQQKVALLHKRVKKFADRDIKRSHTVLIEIACLYADEIDPDTIERLYEMFDLKAIPSRAPKGLYCARTCVVDIRCWRSARVTAAYLSQALDYDFNTREIVCLSLLMLDMMEEDELIDRLHMIEYEKLKRTSPSPHLRRAFAGRHAAEE